MKLPELGDKIMLYPAPRADVEPELGKALPLRCVQDGAGNFGRFLPMEGAERAFDYYWHDRLNSGDVCLSDPRTHYTRGEAPKAELPAGPKKDVR